MRKIIFCVATSLLRLLHVLDAAGCCLFSSVYLLFLLVRVALKRGLISRLHGCAHRGLHVRAQYAVARAHGSEVLYAHHTFQ